ncbi:uncharacterized protein O3C94_017588 isoform 1-T1 [Discoglossus pictus]
MQKMLCLLSSVLLFTICAADLNKEEGDVNKCSQNIKDNHIKLLIDYKHNYENLTRTEINSLIWTAKGVLEKLKDAQKTVYMKTLTSKNCSMPIAPSHGGLVCVQKGSTMYCKPMCNKGYDFSFLRRSRIYEECGEHTRHSWTTQYIGGQRLAECIASPHAVSAVSTAYFSDNMTCEQIITNTKCEKRYIKTFLKELGENETCYRKELDFIVCGE